MRKQRMKKSEMRIVLSQLGNLVLLLGAWWWEVEVDTVKAWLALSSIMVIAWVNESLKERR